MTKFTDFYRINQPIDTFALGHYARVFNADQLETGASVAFKVMRAEHLNSDGELRWEYRAFANEAEILMALAESPHTVKLLECGFVSSEEEAPTKGKIERMGLDVANFSRSLSRYSYEAWRPYLVLEELPRSNNLFYLMKPSSPGTRWRLPSEEGLSLALQFANLLRTAHEKNIVYLDHKLEHVYWDGVHLQIIDFNSSQQLSGKTGLEMQKAKDIHNLCVGILYPIFTGMTPQKTALLPQPGSFSEVQERYTDITSLDFNMEPSLSTALQELLQSGARQGIANVTQFIDALQAVAKLHGWDFPNHYAAPESRVAREHLRNGIRSLRQGENALREARDLFREALILEGISEDMEDELRRMVKAVNDMLNSRVIP
ncbi:hypothetical protein MASR2M15_02350 [Anaerolineales bacterium]